MGVFDKIKNALFEVEYVEVTEKNNKVKEEARNKQEDVKDKPIAKKVVLSNPKRERVHEEKEVVEPKEEIIEEKHEEHNDFKVMDDNDFKVDNNDYENHVEETKYNDEYNNDTNKVEKERVIYRQVQREKAPYGIDENNKNLVQDYGRAYEKKEDRSGFKPSPIISPIYGVLDKNYKKEDVVQKKEVRLSSYSRDNINVDDVRNKAYGKLENEKKEEVKTFSRFEVEEDEEDDSNLLVDLSKDEDKPSIKEVTMGDALEYFQDLGLEYNVDYMDASKEKATGRRVKEHYDEEPELFALKDDVVQEKEPVEEKVSNDSEEKKEEPILRKLPTDEVDIENDDNLFDLIDSMYQEND